MEEVASAGVIVEGEGSMVPCLSVEGDGTGIALLKEDTTRAEARVGVASEAWETVSRDRYLWRTRQFTVALGTAKASLSVSHEV